LTAAPPKKEGGVQKWRRRREEKEARFETTDQDEVHVRRREGPGLGRGNLGKGRRNLKAIEEEGWRKK